jgi:hypothetical protein
MRRVQPVCKDCGAGAAGSSSVKMLSWPRPALCALMRPPCIRVSVFTAASPMPRPPRGVVGVALGLREEVEDMRQQLRIDAVAIVPDPQSHVAVVAEWRSRGRCP